MASTPDPHPDSFPSGPTDDPERVSDPSAPDRESVEDVPGGDNSVASAEVPTIDVAELRREPEPHPNRTIEDAPGDFAGTSGTGGVVKDQDQGERV